MKKIDWIELLKIIAIIAAGGFLIFIFIYFTLMAIFIVLLTGGLVIPKWFDNEKN